MEELESELMELYENLDERDRRIEELEMQVGGGAPVKLGGGGSDDQDIVKLSEERDMLQTDLDKYKDDLMDKNDQIAELQAQLAQRNIENDTLTSDKKNLQDELADTRKVLEEKKRLLLASTKQSEDQKQKHKDGSSVQYQLELENQRLRTTVTEMEENESELVAELEIVSEERSELEAKNDEFVTKCDQLQNEVDTKSTKITELESDYEELSLKVSGSVLASCYLGRGPRAATASNPQF